MRDGKKISRNSFLKLSGMVIGFCLVECGGQTLQVLEGNIQTPAATATFSQTSNPKTMKVVPIEGTTTLEGMEIRAPIDVSDADFETVVLQSELPAIVDFWAPWCGPCKILDPMLDKIADEYAGKLIIVKLNSDQNPTFTEKFGVTGIPTLIFFSNGKVFERQVGAPSEETLRNLVEEFLYIP